MSFLALFLLSIASIVVLLSTAPLHADTYQVYHVGNGNSEENIGLTSTGLAVLYGADNCGTPYCYSTYTKGVLTGTSATLPPLTFDNGSPCSPSLPAGYMAAGATPSVCNGKYAAAFGVTTSGNNVGLFTGQDGALSLIASAPVGDFLVDSLGDVLWLNANSENNYEAFDLTSRAVPEPSTLALLGMGALGIAGAIRRRVLH